MGIPLLRDGAVVGVFVVTRSKVQPFNERHIELLTTFADQAVIAIENARLFDEVQARTRELSEALELQTTTADVLKVISRSVFDLRAVLDTLSESAARLCEADTGAIARQKGDAYYQVAHYGAPPGYDELVVTQPLTPGRGSVVGRVLLEGKSVHIPDVLADPEYSVVVFQRATGVRTLLGVPLLREGKPIGVFVLWRRSVRPFTDKHIELLTTFADQAVIAIENMRLFDEIQDKTQQLEIANKYKSHFIASASHDLRQPLHALNLFIAQLRSESDPSERARLISRIDAAVGSMNDLFGVLLDMTKLDAGILEPNVTEFPVERLFKRIETTFADAALERTPAPRSREQRLDSQRPGPLGTGSAQSRVERRALHRTRRRGHRLSPARRTVADRCLRHRTGHPRRPAPKDIRRVRSTSLGGSRSTKRARTRTRYRRTAWPVARARR